MLLAITFTAATFVHAHNIAVANEKVHVVDTLKIKKQDAQTIAFSLSIAGSEASSCTMDGTTTKVADHFEHTEALAMFDDHPKCVLEIHVTSKGAVVTDVGDVCGRGYCGAQVTIGTTKFKRKR